MNHNMRKHKKSKQSLLLPSRLVSIEGLLTILCLFWIPLVFRLISIYNNTIENEKDNNTTLEYLPLNNLIDKRGKKLQGKRLPKATIAYAVSVTSCPKPIHFVTDGAAVLKHSIYLSSIDNPNSTSLYSYEMIAFLHSDAIECFESFIRLGFEVMIKDTPFKAEDIRQKYLRDHIKKGGCCGDKEFLKLYSFVLIDYPIVVHLDVDTILLKPMDELFDEMLFPTDEKKRILLQFPEKDSKTSKIEAYFTRDYNLVDHPIKHYGIQGGFFIIRPNMKHFQESIQVIMEGNFPDDYRGWGDLGFGGYYGARQVQGFMSYFFDHLHKDTSVELNRCIYNTMIDNPRRKPKPPEKIGICQDTHTYECRDCREFDISSVKLAHFTICQKPWDCHTGEGTNSTRMCKLLHEFWFRTRRQLEESYLKHGLISSLKYSNDTKYLTSIYHGYCKWGGSQGYIPLNIPIQPIID